MTSATAGHPIERTRGDPTQHPARRRRSHRPGRDILELSGPGSRCPNAPGAQATATPIKHLVVIFQENVSFDHYFATYSNATNPEGEPPFRAVPHTPAVNGLTPMLLTPHPNAANPMRLDRFALSDNTYDTVFGPSTPGALDLVSGQTHGATPSSVGSTVVGGLATHRRMR